MPFVEDSPPVPQFFSGAAQSEAAGLQNGRPVVAQFGHSASQASLLAHGQWPPGPWAGCSSPGLLLVDTHTTRGQSTQCSHVSAPSIDYWPASGGHTHDTHSPHNAVMYQLPASITGLPLVNTHTTHRQSTQCSHVSCSQHRLLAYSPLLTATVISVLS